MNSPNALFSMESEGPGNSTYGVLASGTLARERVAVFPDAPCDYRESAVSL